MLIVALLLALGAGASAAPEHASRVLLENEHVRVVDVWIAKGTRTPVHSHPAHLVYALAPAKVRATAQDGTTKTLELAAGQIGFAEAETHSIENLGSAWVHTIEVDLKGGGGERPEASDDPVKVAPGVAKAIFENDRVRVLENRLPPGGKFPWHGHPPIVIVALSSFKIEYALLDAKTRAAEMTAISAFWADPEVHTLENVGTTEAHYLDIELEGRK